MQAQRGEFLCKAIRPAQRDRGGRECSLAMLCGLQMSERYASETRGVQVAKGSEMQSQDPVLKDLNI